MLFMSFAEDDATEEATTVRNSVHQYNRQFSSEPRTVSSSKIHYLTVLHSSLYFVLFYRL